MTLTQYHDGFGRRDPVPECRESIYDRIRCPACDGAGVAPTGPEDTDCRRCFGYGVLHTEMPPEAPRDLATSVDCPCCEGHGAHAFGAGMDADEKPCDVCGAWGWLMTSLDAADREA